MKKFFYTVFIFISIFILSTNVHAAKVGDVNISGTNTITSGEDVVVTIKVNLADLKSTEGIWVTSLGIKYDENYLIPTKLSTPGYESFYTVEDGQIIISGAFIENFSIAGICHDGFLHCGPYTLEITFYAKNTTIAQTTSISVNAIVFGMLDLANQKEEYNEDDIEIITYDTPHNYEIKINPSTNPVEEKNTGLTSKESPTDTSKKTVTTPTKKSSNANLSNILIDNYEIEFNKDNSAYDVTISEKTSKLNITTTTENKNANVEITGNENLKDNSIITIKVSAEDGTTKEYQINITKEKVSLANDIDESSWWNRAILKLKDINTSIIYIASGIIGFIVIIIIILTIKNKINDKEIDKLINKL